MKRLLILLTLPLCSMSPRDKSPKDNSPRPKNMKKHISWDKDMNNYPLPGQIQMENDVKYLGAAYDKMKDKINEQSRIIRVLDTEVHDYMIRLEVLEKKINRVPWYKRLNCLRRK